mgnify:CR=1 FL=1
MINSGIYAFFTIDFDTGKLILTVGRCEDKEKRLAIYRITNAGINFHYFKKVPINQLIKVAPKLKSTDVEDLVKVFRGQDGLSTTPKGRALFDLTPWAIKPATMPLRTSPIPPVAMPGLPSVHKLIKVSFDVLTKDPAPFNKAGQSNFF